MKILYCLLFGLLTPMCLAQPVDSPASQFEGGFLHAIADHAKLYQEADNELKKSAVVTARLNAFRKLKGDPRKITDWKGVLQSMGTTGEGKAYVVVSIAPRVTLGTWNNSLSDISDKSLIPQSSPVYAALANMKVGNVVKFSGVLKRPTNLTESGRMLDPNFLFLFSRVEKVAESAHK